MADTFDLDKAANEIPVPMTINTFDEDTHERTSVNVVHIFGVPDPKTREEYQRKLVSNKGRKVVTHLSDARWYFWSSTILRVEGYKQELKTHDELLRAFSSPVGRIHAENAVGQLIEFLEGEEADWGKK